MCKIIGTPVVCFVVQSCNPRLIGFLERIDDRGIKLLHWSTHLLVRLLQDFSQWLYQQHWLFHHVSWRPVCWVVMMMMMTWVGRPGAVTDMHLNQSRVNKVCVIVVVGVSSVFCPYCVSFVVLYFSCPYCSCPKSFLPLLLCPLSFLFPLLPWRAMVSLVVGSLIAPLCVERLSSRSGPVLWSGGWCCCCGSYWVCPFVGLVSWMYRNLGWILGPSIPSGGRDEGGLALCCHVGLAL